MKNLFFKTALFSVTVLSLNTNANAQGNTTSLLSGGLTDANKLVNAYVSPFLGGMAASLNNGWYNTAKVHGLGGFDISTTLNFVPITDEMKTFDPSALGLSQKNGSNTYFNLNGATSSPTLYGDKKDGPTIQVRQQFDPSNPLTDTAITTFNLPPGLGTPLGLGLPTAQISVGIVKKTEVMIRIMPSITSGNFKVNMFGVGAKHDLSQWFWAADKIPVDISAIAAFTSLNSTYSFGDSYLRPSDNYPNAKTDEEYKSSQRLEFSGSGMMLGAIVSKKFLFFTPYLGVNYTSNKVTMAMKGVYPITVIETNSSDPNFGRYVILNFNDPIEVSRSVNFMRATLGARFHLGPITLNGEYNIGTINTFSVGAGINIQSIAPFKLM